MINLSKRDFIFISQAQPPVTGQIRLSLSMSRKSLLTGQFFF